ncbi:MAG: membrane protein insertion efficiency factor YidD [Alphaproteobacteria bacterium]|nr:MAG: membrane protein insertion efficiency factor YidD [Alphaproteobacteria bacterium]
MKLFTAIMLVLIRLYQLTFSYFIGRQCRFEPTCSTYAYEMILKNGLLKGGGMALKRLSKCHPWGTTNDQNEDSLSKK